MQGAERELILVSTVYDKKSAGQTLNMIDESKNLLNVMVSRAKQSIYLFGEKEIFINAPSDSPTALIGKYLQIDRLTWTNDSVIAEKKAKKSGVRKDAR